MQVELPAELIRQVAAEAILNAITAEQRQTIIKSAVAYLLTPVRNGYREESPITQAFHEAIRHAATRVAVEMFEKDESVTQKIKDLLTEALEKVMVQDREQMVKRIADAIAAGMAYRER